MKKYDSYKDSGVEWIGEVPSHWEVVPLKYYSSCNDEILSEKTDEETPINYVEISDVSQELGIYNSTEYTFKDAPSRARRIVRANDIIVSTVRTYLKAIAKVENNDYIVSTGFAVVRSKNIHAGYLYYALCNECFLDSVLANSTGVSYPAIKSSDLVNLKIVLPETYQEQLSISNYLDKKCYEIDKVISTLQKRIALLQELKQSTITHAVTKGLNPNVKMKDSGVEWIGEVPKHWEICRLKHISKIFGRIGFRGYNQTDLVAEGDGAITLSPSNMQNGKMNFDKCSYLSWDKYYESPEIMIKNEDILFVKTGSTYGKTSLVENLPMEATINPQIVVFKEIKGNSHFLSYLLSNEIVQRQVALTVGGSTIPTLSQENISNYIIPIPVKSEQDTIASFLDKKCTAIDASISKAQHQVDLLQEYKQSLITEVVTGKRKVC